MGFLQILPLLNCHKINTRTNFKNPYHNFQDLKAKCVLLPENSCWVEQILQRPTSKYPKIKTFFVMGSLCLLSKCQVEIIEFKQT